MPYLNYKQQLRNDIFPNSRIQGLFTHFNVEFIDQLAADGVMGFVFTLSSHKGKALGKMVSACTVSSDKQDLFAFFNLCAMNFIG
jgi:hypothetical protein